MNPEDFINVMNGGSRGTAPSVTKEQVDEFIERCCKERGYDEHSLHDQIVYKLTRDVHSPLEAEILPLVIKRINGQL